MSARNYAVDREAIVRSLRVIWNRTDDAKT
jgi:hypothetical protein